MRAALGAGRARLVRQLLTECLVLAMAAAPLGLLVAWAGVVWLRGAMPVDMVPYTVQWQIDARTMIYTVAVAALTGIVFGLAPAVQAGRVNLVESLRDGSRGSGTSGRRARLRNALVTIEVALALVLLVGAALFVRSFVNLQSASVGFDPAPVLGLRFFMAGEAYAAERSRIDRVDDILRRVESLPGVEWAAASNFLPLQAGGGGGQVIVDGRAVTPGEEPSIAFIATTPHLHRALGLSMLRGRDFTDAEGMTKSAVAVIDETMAQRLWVRRRTAEIGIRAALGANQSRLLSLVVGQALAMAAAGVLVGAILAAGLTRLIETQLYAVQPMDWVSFVATAAIMLFAATAASLAPALRALRLNPIEALRSTAG